MFGALYVYISGLTVKLIIQNGGHGYGRAVGYRSSRGQKVPNLVFTSLNGKVLKGNRWNFVYKNACILYLTKKKISPKSDRKEGSSGVLLYIRDLLKKIHPVLDPSLVFKIEKKCPINHTTKTHRLERREGISVVMIYTDPLVRWIVDWLWLWSC